MTQVLSDRDGNLFELHPIRCPTCEVDDAAELGIRGGVTHRYGLGVETTIVRCRRCGLIYPRPFPAPLDIQRLYGDPESYFANHNARAKIEASRVFIRECIRRTGRAHPAILDVGSGRGEVVKAGQLEGVPDVVGLELSEAMAREAARLHDVELRLETVEEHARRHAATYDAIVANAVLEHVHDPDSFVAACARLSREGAIFYLDLPREPHLASRAATAWDRIRGRRSVYYLAPTWPPFHVFGFNQESLEALLEKHGFATEDVHVAGSAPIRATGGATDSARAALGSVVNRVARAIGDGHNMSVWARFRGAPD